eukprot:1176047-Prorocentrum_minimum.AAC.5
MKGVLTFVFSACCNQNIAHSAHDTHHHHQREYLKEQLKQRKVPLPVPLPVLHKVPQLLRNTNQYPYQGTPSLDTSHGEISLSHRPSSSLQHAEATRNLEDSSSSSIRKSSVRVGKVPDECSSSSPTIVFLNVIVSPRTRVFVYNAQDHMLRYMPYIHILHLKHTAPRIPPPPSQAEPPRPAFLSCPKFSRGQTRGMNSRVKLRTCMLNVFSLSDNTPGNC